MSTPPTPPTPDNIEDHLALYFDNQATPEVCQAIQDWLEQDPANAEVFAEYGYIERMIFCAKKKEDASAIFGLLAEMEASAEAEIVEIKLEEAVTTPQDAQVKLSGHDFAEAGRYLFEHATANKRVLYTAGSAIAAVLLLALTLFLVFSGGQDKPAIDPLANKPLWDTPTPAHRPVVATLTDSVGAQWRADDKPVSMPMGAQLVAYERLTLTHGFAEITTRRGAKALLQAPCIIELTDSDNAIRLHQGKLVGKCETQASKGFTVHAPGMDVVDLGTQFGVKADAAEGSMVLVMNGTVRAQPTEQSPLAFTPVVLEQDQARRVVLSTGGLEPIAVAQAPTFFGEKPDAYAAAVLDAAPLAYWRFNENRDGVIPNEVAPGTHDLQVIGAAHLKTGGVHGSTGHFSNDTDRNGYFFLDSGLDAIGKSGNFTISCWFWAEEVHQGTLMSLFVDEQADYKHVALLELQPDYDVSARGDSGWASQSIRGVHCDPPLRDGAKGTNIYSKDPYTLNEWQHIVLVKDAERLVMYLNGKHAWELPTGPDVHGEAKLAIGLTPLMHFLNNAPEDAMRPLLGSIDEVAVYDRPLTIEEIKAHWQAGQQPERQP
ncbi:MAG: hypothetical protein KTR15_04700 [Phycisphaeraceae bacterium]|nr:hypothetical protein [Phycisphaeraceae bacterium]